MTRESSEAIDIAASDWLARRDSGRWSAADQVDFDRWLDASTFHRVAYLRVEHAWEEALRLKALGAGAPTDRVPSAGQLLSPFFDPSQEAHELSDAIPRRRSWLRWAIAATVFVVAFTYQLENRFAEEERHSTPLGGIASFPLKDGSNVTLNTDSEIQVAVTNRERRVHLERGEAFFDVAKDPAHAFIVEIGDKRVIAVGTKFAVRRDAGDIFVVVTEGKVRIETAGRKHMLTESLPAGTVGRVTDAGTVVQSKSLAEAEDYLAWLHGILVFHEITLAEATAEFNRYNGRKIVIEDPAVGALRIGGVFRSTGVDGFVGLLEQGYPVRVVQQKDRIVLMGYTPR